jgi:hypothetical protein
MELWTSVTAIVVAIFSLGLTCWLQHRIAKLQRKPALVFVYTKAGWELRNVGYGPALNVLMARQAPVDTDWIEPVRIPPLSVNSVFGLTWDSARRAANNRWRVRYEAIDGTCYMSECVRDHTEIARDFPDPWPNWPEKAVSRPWELSSYRRNRRSARSYQRPWIHKHPGTALRAGH